MGFIDGRIVQDTDGKSILDKIGNLTNLTTPTKTDLVSAINSNTSSLADKASKAEVAAINASPKGVYATVSALQTDLPTGNSNIYLVTGNVKEVDSLTISSAPTTSGNVTVTLNGVATNIAVTIGTAEVDTLTVSGAATASGNITITLNGVATNVAVTSGDTVGAIGDKIRATTFSGWNVGGTTGSATVTFTKTSVGAVSAPAYSAGTIGATGSIVRTTTGVAADDVNGVATKIRGTSFSGWTSGGTGTTVTFTANVAQVNTAPSYSAGTTGTTGTMSVTTTGVAPDGNWYYWSGSAWTAGGVYQATFISDKAITYTKINDNVGDGLVRAFNLCDKSTLTTGGYLGASGAVVSGNFQYSDYIPVEVGKTYCWYGAFNITYQAVAYDINKNFIRNIFQTDLGGAYHAYTYTIPAGTYFIRFNMNTSGDLYNMVVEGSTYPATYTAYAPVILSSKFIKGIQNTLASSGLLNGSVTSPMLNANAGDGLVQMLNICDYSKITKDYYLDVSGNAVSAANQGYSDYIPVTVGLTYCWYGAFSLTYQLVTYDVNKTMIASVPASSLGGAYHAYTYVVPSNVAFIRFNMSYTTQANTMVVQGTTYPATYTPYGQSILSNNLITGIKNSLNLGIMYTDSNFNTSLGQFNLTNVPTSPYAIKYSTALGYNALKNLSSDGTTDSGDYNTAIGANALQSNTTGNHNTAVGFQCSNGITTGTGNTAVGEDSLFTETTGVGNTTIGQRAMQNSVGATNNTAIGVSAMYFDSTSNVTGTDNTAIGHYAGSRTSSDTDCTFLGHFANKDNKANSYSDSTAIGANAIVNKSHQVMLGSPSVTEVDTYGDFQCLTNGKGLILLSPSGNRFKLTVSDVGALTINPA